MKPNFRLLVSFGSGLGLGTFFHYVLYRLSLTTEPFIYFSF